MIETIGTSMNLYKILALILVFQFGFRCAQGADPASEIKQAAAAREVLKSWHAQNPESGERYLHIVCWTPADRELPANHRERLTRIMTHIQSFYLKEMERFGFEGSTIGLKFEEDGQLAIHEVRGQHPDEHYERQSGREIRSECQPVLEKAGIDPDQETVLIMCNLANWDEVKLRFTHKSPYYASGSYRRGTAWQLDSPELDTDNLKLKKPIIIDGEYGRISLGKHNSIFIGGIAHELGHALGLPHCMARPDEAYRGTALMGSGNRTYGDEIRNEGQGSFLTLAHVLRLASHPQFSGSIKGINKDSSLEMNDLSITAEDKSIRISGNVRGEPPIYAVVAYFDSEGRGDYDAKTATTVPLEDGRFELSCDALSPGKKGELRIFPLHANGSAGMQMSRTRFRYPYSVNADGTPDVSVIEARTQLKPLIAALTQNRKEVAMKIANKLDGELSSSIAERLLSNNLRKSSPPEIDSEVQSVKLTDTIPLSEKVGWGRPAYDRVPDQSMLLEANGEIFVTGIYAHAPAKHEYQLDDRWRQFTGKVGIATGRRGTVQFEIQGDGRSLWKSKTIGPDDSASFDVSLKGVRQLQLLTYPTSDGPGSDWGFWLEPELHR